MKTRSLMLTTTAALAPGIVLMTWYFGVGILINLTTAILVALITEAAALKLKSPDVALPVQVQDGTIVLTGALLGLCLPPLLPLWMVVLGTVLAVLLGKHVYGGTGQNVFNPAMVGYCILILSFPLGMSHWPSIASTPGLIDTIAAKISLTNLPPYDGLTAATPLDSYRFREGLTNAEFFQIDNTVNWQVWATINVGFLAGGLYLLSQRLIPWQTPVALLGTLLVLSLVFYDGGSSVSLGSPLFHLLSGATMMAAFFVVTDPVTCPTFPLGLIIFGIGVGLITFIIRSIGAYPEGIAFGVLLMNACSPLIDHLLTRRVTK